MALCERACALQEQQCGQSARECVPSCSSIVRAPGADRCLDRVERALGCLLREGFVCEPGGDGEVPPACRAEFEAVQRCIGADEPVPVPVSDAGRLDV